LSGETPDWKKIAHRTEFDGIEHLRNHTATSIQLDSKTISVKNQNHIRTLDYDSMVIGTGAVPIKPPVPGI
jgi:NADPH-dependent 2,4-dienoyl-CoA reductase/sulfur reductase-like enzyme